MTRTQAWDRVWAILQSKGIPSTKTQCADRVANGHGSGLYVLLELERLAELDLPIHAIEMIGELTRHAYNLGQDDMVER